MKTSKECKTCGEVKQLTDYQVAYYSKVSQKPILKSYCKDCSTKRATQYFQANPHKRAEADRKWYLNNTEKKLQYVKDYKSSIPPAVYALFADNMLLYIGESGEPASRKIDHFCKSNVGSPIAKSRRKKLLRKDELEYVILHYEDDDDKRYAVEQAYIKALQPPLNTRGKK